MSFATERALFKQECEAYYAGSPHDVADLERELHAVSAAHPEWGPFARKAFGYGEISRRCPVKVFRHYPFAFELVTGRPRTTLGGDGIGEWMKREPGGLELAVQGQNWWELCESLGLSSGWRVLDDNHHSLGYDTVFRFGLRGIIRQAEVRRQRVQSEAEAAFLSAVITGNQALIAVSHRFADEAERMGLQESDPGIRHRLVRLAQALRHAPGEPPATFFEAVNSLLLLREVVQSLEGNGISILGHLDRILWPFYQHDCATGELTRAAAKDLLCFLLALFDVRFGLDTISEHVGTNTTIMIGGCDAGGEVVFNDLTRMIIEIYLEHGLVDPKLNARISARHPAAYHDLLAGLVSGQCSSLAIFNDHVVIPANVRMGKAEEDCRLYEGGGCQENVLANTEVNSRASIYLNTVQVLLMGCDPQRWSAFLEREGISVLSYDQCCSFPEFYQRFLHNLAVVNNAHILQRNRTEREGIRYNPCPLHSSTIQDCIKNARDMMAGGARYSFGSVAQTGIGTVVDALHAIHLAVYQDQRVSLSAMAQLLAGNFEGDEVCRQYLLRRIPKYGQDDPAIHAFAAQVFRDVARVTSGQPNTRGGRYEASLFSFRLFTTFGLQTGATPDGRRAGEHLSSGMSPSQLAWGISSSAGGGSCSAGQVLDAIAPLDLTDYPVVGVLDLKLPAGCSPEQIVPVIRRFVSSGGSVLQLSCVDTATLMDAKAHPERHRDLVVRISGFSAYFAILPEEMQDEVIRRATAQV